MKLLFSFVFVLLSFSAFAEPNSDEEDEKLTPCPCMWDGDKYSIKRALGKRFYCSDYDDEADICKVADYYIKGTVID